MLLSTGPILWSFFIFCFVLQSFPQAVLHRIFDRVGSTIAVLGVSPPNFPFSTL